LFGILVIDRDGYAEREASCTPLLLLGFGHASSKWREVASKLIKRMRRERAGVNTTLGSRGGPFRGGKRDCRFQIVMRNRLRILQSKI